MDGGRPKGRQPFYSHHQRRKRIASEKEGSLSLYSLVSLLVIVSAIRPQGPLTLFAPGER